MKYRALLLCLFLPALLSAQANCDYDKLLREGKTFAKQRQYKKALYKYNSARRCDRDKGEEVDAAIEALLDQVEGEKKTADLERERAEKEKRAADKALADLRKTSEKVVENLLRDAENEIYHLHYADALEKMNAAAEIGLKKTEVARALMEAAFFYAESGRFREAQDITAAAARLFDKNTQAIRIDSSDVLATRLKFRQVLQSLDPARYAELEARYYPVMAPLKGGKFNMGSEDGEEDEMPVHEVELSDFQLARTETTVWQYNLYLAATGRNIFDEKVISQPGWGWEGDNPIVYVSWYDAVVYANWLSRQWGRTPAYTIDSVGRTQYDGWKVELNDNADGFRLPTEAEWEYAARGGPQQYTYRYAGGDSLELVARFRENSSNRAQPVGSRLPVKPDPANPQTWLFDMSGNVWEWCGDWYTAKYNKTLPNMPGKKTQGPKRGGSRILRGGCWNYTDDFCRVARRFNDVPTSKLSISGFRMAHDK